MTYVEESVKEVNEMIPEDGFNVCYFDDFADAGEKLTLIKHCETREEAEEIVKEHEDEIVYIYEGENEAEEGMSVHKNHNIDRYLDIALKDYLEGKNRPNIEYEDTNYGGESKPTAYGIENMIDDIASKSLSEDEKKQIEDSDELKKHFSLDTLLDLIADKLDKKNEKKLGVESRAFEGGKGSGRTGHQKWMLAGEAGEECPNCMMLTERENGKCVICGQ